MNTEVLYDTAEYLTSVGVTPYDLWMAIGQKDKVPKSKQMDSLERVSARDGIIIPVGFARNAIEDLKAMNFPMKDKVIADLQAAIKGGGLKAGARPRVGTGFSGSSIGYGAYSNLGYAPQPEEGLYGPAQSLFTSDASLYDSLFATKKRPGKAWKLNLSGFGESEGGMNYKKVLIAIIIVGALIYLKNR